MAVAGSGAEDERVVVPDADERHGVRAPVRADGMIQ
jgi:hypothetical protein